MGLLGSLRGWSLSCLSRSHRYRLSGKDLWVWFFFPKGVNIIEIHGRPVKFLRKLFQQKHYQLG